MGALGSGHSQLTDHRNEFDSKQRVLLLSLSLSLPLSLQNEQNYSLSPNAASSILLQSYSLNGIA